MLEECKNHVPWRRIECENKIPGKMILPTIATIAGIGIITYGFYSKEIDKKLHELKKIIDLVSTKETLFFKSVEK